MSIGNAGFRKNEDKTSKMWAPAREEETPRQPCLLFLTGVETGHVLDLCPEIGGSRLLAEWSLMAPVKAPLRWPNS